jgi:hypothetical protein
VTGSRDFEDDGRSRDRIAALAHGFRNLSESLDRRYRRVAWLCIAAAAISLVTLVGNIVIERARVRDQTTRQLSAATYRICQREAVGRGGSIPCNVRLGGSKWQVQAISGSPRGRIGI